jgi:DNA-binding NarL/FixJ family response regulator
MSIRVVIADDHPIVRDGLRFCIERSGQDIRVVGESANGQEVLDCAGKLPADVYILDITMPVLNGLETARQLIRSVPSAKIIMLSLLSTQALVEEALAIGVRGYLTKETASRNLVEAVTEVYAGRVFFSPDIADIIVNRYVKGAAVPQTLDRPAALTAQERKILQLVAEGATYKEVAAKLDLSSNTVHTHRKNLMAKLNIHRQADLVRYAIREGIAKL